MNKTKTSRLATLLLVFIFLVGCGQVDAKSTNALNEPSSASQELVRETAYGKVKGKKENDAMLWLGIPYGGDTGGENRWKAPTQPAEWSDIKDATQAGEAALQEGKDGVIGGENALNLDVYRPNNQKKSLPVMVYLHGGNNQTSNAQEIPWGSFSSEQNVVVVSLNYRLGALGFNPLPALKNGTDEENSGNYTLLDIAQGLEWVHSNINAFGGDENNVTVSGFSAGGRDIMAMLISPLFKGAFDKAVVWSGGMTLAEEADSQQVFAEAFSPLVVEDGVKATEEEAISWLLSDDAAVRDYLYKLDGARMAPLMGNAGIRMGVFPHLYMDGTVIPKEGFNTTTFNDVPLWLLASEQEFSLFALSDPYFKDKVLTGDDVDEKAKSEYEFVNKYGGHLYSLFNVKETATQISPNYNADIYAMEILFGENASVVGQPMGLVGSFHGVFVPLLNPEKNNYTQYMGKAYDSEGAKQMASWFKTYLASFMADGTPKGDDLPVWNKWSLDEKNNTLFLNANKSEATAIMGEKSDTAEDVLKAMQADTTLSEEEKRTLITTVLNGRWFSTPLDIAYGVETPFDAAA